MVRKSRKFRARDPQDAPGVARVIGNPAFPFDQLRHPRRSPQTGYIAQSLRTLLEPALDLSYLLCTQTRLAGPALPASFSPARPFSRSSAAHWLNDCRCAPTRRATSDSLWGIVKSSIVESCP
jgi:hypothetical protein